jgi:hypothetical protein
LIQEKREKKKGEKSPNVLDHHYLSIDNCHLNINQMSISTIKTLGEFMTDCARTTHRLSCYTPLPSHAEQV